MKKIKKIRRFYIDDASKNASISIVGFNLVYRKKRVSKPRRVDGK